MVWCALKSILLKLLFHCLLVKEANILNVLPRLLHKKKSSKKSPTNYFKQKLQAEDFLQSLMTEAKSNYDNC